MTDDLNDAVSAAVELADTKFVEAEAPAPYRLRIIGNKRELEPGAVIEGIVQNVSIKAWGQKHRIGLRNFQDSAGRLIEKFELRADIGLGSLAPGEQSFFRIDLQAAGLPSNATYFTLDVVEEGVKWLEEDGGTSIDFTIRSRLNNPSEWLHLFDRLRNRIAPVAAQKLDIIEQSMSRLSAIANPPARRLTELLACRHRDEAYRPIRPDSAAITRAVHREGAHDPNSVFIEHFAAATGRLILDADGESYGGIFAPFTRGGTPIFGVGNAPLPTAMCDWLGRRALPRSISTTPATRSMLATLSDNELVDINPTDGGIEQFWRFAKSVIVDLNIAKSALPDALLRALAGSAAPHSNLAAFPNLTIFTERFVTEGALGKLPRDFELDEDRLATAIECYLIGLENEGLRTLLGPDVTSWLEEPLDNAADFSPLELILLIVAGSKPRQNELQSDDLAILRSAISWLAPDRSTNVQPTLRILGLHSSSSGLGTNMRMSERVCSEIGLPVELVDTQLDQILPACISEDSPIALSRPVDLFHLNLDEVPGIVCRYTQQDRRETYRIGFALWETSAMPEQHKAGMQLVDEIWAPTAYVADVYRAAGHPNVHVIGKGIELPEPKPFDLSCLGIPIGLTVFLAAFDMGSWIDRKNPIAAVQGFQRAFPRDPDVRLIIKSNGLIQHPGDRTNQAARLEASAEADPRIILISELLPFQSYLGLIQAVSATVSPHRAEGFGYFPAYSLLLGVPTIVTDHSGTKDFCTEETSFPVRASMRILRQGEFVYDAPNASWADIDVNHLAERMREVRDNPKEACRRAQCGREILERRYSMSAMAARYLERLSQI